MSLQDYYPARIRQLPDFPGAFTAHQLAAQGCRVLFASYPGGTEIAPHRHDTDNVGVITRGALHLTMNGQTRVIRAGEWYEVPAHQEHSARFEEDTAEIEFWFDPGSG